MKQNFLDVRGLNKHFGGLHAIKDVDFCLAKGEKSAIIGPNGAGKSTFFNLLTGYHSVDAGKVLFNGSDITNRASHAIARMGVLRAFQISNIFPRLSVFHNVRSAVQAQMGRSFNLFERANRVGNDEAIEIIELCGLRKEENVLAGELSQGDKKKLELALALAGRPKLLLLDEPTAGMSLEETRETMSLVDRLNRDHHITILFTEHDMSVVFDHAQKITLLHYGEVVLVGTPEEVRTDRSAQRIYFGEHS